MPKKREIPQGFSDALLRYKNLECSTVDLAREFSANRGTIRVWMNELGVEANNPQQASAAKVAGKQGCRLGAKHSAEAKLKISLARKGKPGTTTGFKFSDASKQKMREAKLQYIQKNGVEKLRSGHAKWLAKNKLTEEERIARDKTRQACKRMLRRILTMARTKKDGRRSEDLLGYTKQDLRLHLESQLKDGMSWTNRDSFHIDHIKPVAAFFREGVFDPAVINALSNLQVLTPEENRRKSDSFDGTRKQALVIDNQGTRAFV